MFYEKISVVIIQGDGLCFILRGFHSINILRKHFVHFRLGKRRVQHRIGKQIQTLIHILGQELSGKGREIRSGVCSKAASDKIQIFRKPLRASLGGALAQQSCGHGSEPFFSSGIGNGPCFHDRR